MCLFTPNILKALNSSLRAEFAKLGYKDKNQVYTTVSERHIVPFGIDHVYEVTYHIYHNVIRKVYVLYKWENTDDIVFNVVDKKTHIYPIEDSLKKELCTPFRYEERKKLIDFNILNDVFDFSNFGYKFDETTSKTNRFPTYVEHIEDIEDIEYLIEDLD
jgi:hypothetical protein